jgi:hypothetical protein
MKTSAGPTISTRTGQPRRRSGRVRPEYRPSPTPAEGTAGDETGIPAPPTSSPLSPRDLAVLRAVAAGRCEMPAAAGGSLTVDGLCFCDQFVGPRLASAGLIAAGPRTGPVRLTASGRELLEVA